MKHRNVNRPKFLFVLMAIGGVLLFGALVMLLWNAILPEVTNASRINYWQALGILVLSKILFGGFRGGWYGRGRWKRHMEERLASMTPEEREKFKAEWKNRCSRYPSISTIQNQPSNIQQGL